jgi:hypothetical protein
MGSTRRRYLVAVVLVFAALLLLVGCSATKPVTLPAEPTSLRSEAVDSLLSKPVLPAIEPEAARTRPRSVTTFTDSLDAPATDLVRAEVSREGVIVVTPIRRYNFEPPAYGETLNLRARYGGSVEARLTGSPEPRTVTAEVREPPQPWHTWLWGALRNGLAAVGAVTLLAVATLMVGRVVLPPFAR